MSQKFVYVKCVEGRPVPHFGAGGGKIRFIGCRLNDNSWTFYPDKPVRIAFENWVRNKKSYDRAVRVGDLIICTEKEYEDYHNPPPPVEDAGAEKIEEKKPENIKIKEEKAEDPQKEKEKPDDKPAKKPKRSKK